MQRIANLFERITPEVLEEASRKACASRKNKLEVAEYLSDKTRLLTALYEQVRGGVFHSSTYRMFTLNERGKERLVADLPLYPDRILHWAICIVAEPELNRKLIAQTYASIPGRGYHQAVRQVYDYIRNDKRVRYALVFDVHHFFPEIKIPILKRKLENSIKDRRFLELMFRLLDEYSLPGLPLGNRYSPMLANLYLSKMDHTLKENHHVHYYVRFMDDVCILGYSKEWLHRILGIVRELLAEDGLELKKNYQIFPIDSRGIPFLGYRIYTDHVMLKKDTKVRMKKKLAEVRGRYEAGEGLDSHDLGVVASYNGVLDWCEGRNLRKKVMGFLEEGRSENSVGPPSAPDSSSGRPRPSSPLHGTRNRRSGTGTTTGAPLRGSPRRRGTPRTRRRAPSADLRALGPDLQLLHEIPHGLGEDLVHAPGTDGEALEDLPRRVPEAFLDGEVQAAVGGLGGDEEGDRTLLAAVAAYADAEAGGDHCFASLSFRSSSLQLLQHRA